MSLFARENWRSLAVLAASAAPLALVFRAATAPAVSLSRDLQRFMDATEVALLAGSLVSGVIAASAHRAAGQATRVSASTEKLARSIEPTVLAKVIQVDKDAIAFKAGYDQAQADVAAEALGATKKTKLLWAVAHQGAKDARRLSCPACMVALAYVGKNDVDAVYCGPLRRVVVYDGHTCDIPSHHLHHHCKHCRCESVSPCEGSTKEA